MSTAVSSRKIVIGGPAGHGSPHAGQHVGKDRRCDAARYQRPHEFDLRCGAHNGPPVSGLRPVPLFVKGVDPVGPLWGDGLGPRGDVLTSGRQFVIEGSGETLVGVRRESVHLGDHPLGPPPS